MHKCWQYAIGVGSNLGDRRATIAQAATLLDISDVGSVVARSPFSETAPVGGPSGQGNYLNGIWIVASDFLVRVPKIVSSRAGETSSSVMRS